jgi:hypothetical protein
MCGSTRPKRMHIDYVNPARMIHSPNKPWISYFINDHYSVALVDHMKYVLQQNQVANF